jgi:NAD+--asparagine ADP-ribosyltransferase
LAYRAQADRAFKKPEKSRDKLKKKGTERDWLKEAMALLRKMKSKQRRRYFRQILDEHT